MADFLIHQFRSLLGNNKHVIENNIDLGNEILLTIAWIKPIENQQLEKTSLFLKELFDSNTISSFVKTETNQLIMFQIMIKKE